MSINRESFHNTRITEDQVALFHQRYPGLVEQTLNIYAVGRNYAAHIRELGNQKPAEPVLFGKSLSSLSLGPELTFPGHLGAIHHELELVLRIGGEVPIGSLQGLGCVSHMALGLDFTARELQDRLKAAGLPWHAAKSFQDACFLGPLRKVASLEGPFRFKLFVNDQLRQDGDSGHMIFGFEEILASINRSTALWSGDLVFTGTPAGVGPVADGDALRLVCEALDTDCRLHVRIAKG